MGVQHGFLKDGSSFITIDVPGAMLTSATGINALGVIAGQFEDSAGKSHGFVFDGATFTFIDILAAEVFAHGPNILNSIVGLFLIGGTGHAYEAVVVPGPIVGAGLPGLVAACVRKSPELSAQLALCSRAANDCPDKRNL
jgi:probable HAF family extracellular repeat protein